MAVPKIIIEKVETFERNYKAYKSSSYKEDQLRQEFINPFFEAMGWDIDNSETKAAPAYRDVIHEDSIKTKDGTKAPDYCFTLTGHKKFFVETKKPFVKINVNPEPAKQLRRYAFTAEFPISILTNFEFFIIYSATKRVKPTDKANTELIECFHYKDYIESWEKISNIFSKKAVVQGLFDKYGEELKERKGTEEVSEEFLKDIESWRENLAKNIALRNKAILDDRTLNSAVQKTIDRIIFLRMAEDKGIEKYKQMYDLASEENIYQKLCGIFKAADEKYNSGLFHFTKEKGRTTLPDELTLNLIIDDKVLRNIIKSIYPPVSPYAFSHLSPEILGHIYEQFLGKVIKIKGRSAVIEDKPEVKKAGGVYYTPQYIVDYIVKNALGKLLKGKTPNQISEIKILDPACGSGSFLLSAYKYLLDYHLNYYEQNYSKRYKDFIYKGKMDQWFLTVKEKKRILLNNIYGVDIDQQAVEVTKLSLLLKVLEGENKDVFEQQQKLWRERALPDLGNNIKCGNSLMGPDYLSEPSQTQLFDDDELFRLNLFDWPRAFPEAHAQDGFDVIIGNPPYGASLTKEERDYMKKTYDLGNTDTAALMMAKAHSLTKNGGYNGFIVPKPFAFSSVWRKTRELLINEMFEIVDVGKVWKEVKLEQVIYLLNKGKPKSKYRSLLRDNKEMRYPIDIPKSECERFGFIINGLTHPEFQIGKKIFESSKFLDKYLTNTRGTGFQRSITDNKAFYRAIGGKQISRGRIEGEKGFVPKTVELDENAFIGEGNLLFQNLVAHITKPVDHIKIIGTVVSKEESANVIILDTVNQMKNLSGLSSTFFLAWLHSKLINWYVYRFIYAKAIRTMHFDGPVTSRIPVFPLDMKNKEDKKKHDEIVKLTDQINEYQDKLADSASVHEKEVFARQVEYCKEAIDKIIYEFYKLKPEEIDIIEKQMK